MLYGRDGNDRLLALDTQPDTVAGGDGQDSAFADRVDRIRSCEDTKLPPRGGSRRAWLGDHCEHRSRTNDFATVHL